MKDGTGAWPSISFSLDSAPRDMAFSHTLFTLAAYAVMPRIAHAFSSEKPPIRSASMPEQK